ncbi:winged helix-turn-helix domain-containing protein [Congregibacter litoralis]|uniref:Winged helix-turn-helix domain-containing protein n=1 Tax=Congregibacter litoralis KT71 TaxID=314285 RepID=A4AAZ4_9GAMM|nr:crosslink repair DNA glycosylase YcaQ family protein [Congregibacter litoralis]EAQ96866.1 hypothetical protein KT71_11214 [Congregibacter litoralis KT71]
MSIPRLRRHALAAQGLLQSKPFGSGIAGAVNAINHLGYVQIDSISVVERAHHHVLYSRVPGFIPTMTNQLLTERKIFEYWSHAAAFLPMEDFRFSLPYKNAIKNGKVHWFKSPDRPLMRRLLERIRVDGPLRSRDLETTRPNRAGWWDWKPAKKALEQLYMEGELMVSDREGFQKTYDLTERVLPSQVNTQTPGIEEFAEHLLQQQLRCHACVSLRGVTYLRKDSALRKAVKHRVEEGLGSGELEELRSPPGEAFVVEAGMLERKLPRAAPRMRILSPFDNAVIQRERLKTLFDYDYQLECYVPAAKRRHGYFSLPLLYRDDFVGRMDCKAHRKDRRLEIKSLHCEAESFGDDPVIDAFADAVGRFTAFQGCEVVTLDKVYPARLAQRLRSALKR